MSVSQHRRKDAPIARQRWSTLAFTALGLLLAQPAAYAAGFGQLRVQSNLGQPLQAEIDISGVSAEEADGLTVKLASPDAYAKAGLTYLPAVKSLRLQVERRPNGSYVARVRSTQPLSEPFVDILVDMTWASGKVSRAYTFLLDPAGAKPSNQTFSPTTVVQAGTPDDAGAAGPAASAPAPSAAPVPAAAPAPVAASQAPRPQAKAPAPRPHRAAAPVAEGTAAAAGVYTVQRGDNLTAIANEASQGQDAVSLDQMLVALYRNNPNAFIGGNMNRLKAGAVLKVPSQQEAQAVTPRAARREVVARTQGFDAYRSRLATAAAARTVEAGSGREQSGNVTARVQEQAAPAAGPRDELKLSKPERGSQAAAAAAESSIAKERQLKEAEARLAQLEKNVSDMQRLVELKNAELAKLAQTQKSAGTDGAAAPSAAPAVVPAGTAKADAGATAAPVTAEAGAGASSATAAAATAATAAPLAGSPASAVSAAAGASSANASVADNAVVAAKPDAASTPAAKRPPVVTQPQPVAQPSFIEDLLANPMLLPGGGLLIALLGGYAIYRRRQQQKSSENAAFGDSILSQESTVMAGGNSLFGAAGGQSVDTSQHSVFGADFRIGNNTAEANEVDPIAEADVYIAYGRDVQAEEILREALQQNPERQAIRLKLMEIHNNRQDVEGFRVIAEEMFAQTGGQGAEWVQAAEMGRRLEPGNALYLSVAPDTASGDTTTLPGDQWRTHDPSQDPAAAPRETALADLADLALPLDGFPAPAAGAPITAPESASLVFGNADALPEALATRLDDGLDLDLDLPAPQGHGAHEDILALDTPTRSRPLDFDMSGISLDLNPDSRDDTVGDSHETRTFYGASSLPAPTMLRDGKLSEPIDLSRVSAESGLDTSRGISPSTLSADVVDGGRDMQIKFDLARAYIEIGDKEGARELLQEVVDQSQDPLLTEARSLLRDVA
ncbi:FimV/HubP family polar landmark protein [Cupriavidus basilensis]|uniref:FimV/HubP family polar landmark protein n=1 Tax=Cupriavidus basilensis TaxID=68895 RepID=UPI0023E7FA91|nr:FimV/HubP family polar landmark protein [Cupriavidus basilensis]MDF3882569.1 FimV/HubP family polar landmark protein [Cupriavidus basilensis]